MAPLPISELQQRARELTNVALYAAVAGVLFAILLSIAFAR